MQALLQRATSKWQWKPTLLEVNDDRVRVFTGFRMGLRLVTGLGPRRAWRVARLAWEAGALLSMMKPPMNSGRRTFLHATAVAAAGVFIPRSSGSGQSSGDDTTVIDLPPAAARPYLEAATSSSQYHTFLDKLQRDYPDVFTVDLANSRASEIQSSKQKDKGQIVVAIPLTGGAGYSGFSIAFDLKDDHITEDMATFAIVNPDQNIAVEVMQRGKTVINVTITPDGAIVDLKKQEELLPISDPRGLSSGTSPVSAFMPSLQSCNCFCCLQGCLASQGIPAWAVTLIGVVCALTCGTFTPACFACLLTIVFIASGTYNYCAGRCVNTGCCGYSC